MDQSRLLRGWSFIAQETPRMSLFQMFRLQLLGKNKNRHEIGAVLDLLWKSMQDYLSFFLRRNIWGAFALNLVSFQWETNMIKKILSLNITNGRLLIFIYKMEFSIMTKHLKSNIHFTLFTLYFTLRNYFRTPFQFHFSWVSSNL